MLFLCLGSLVGAAPRQSVIEAAKKEGKLVWWAALSPLEAVKMIERFNQLYPFVKVDYWRGTTDAKAERVWAEYQSGRHTWDVVSGGEPTDYPPWIKAGIIQKWSVPGLAKLPKEVKDPEGYWAIVEVAVGVPAAYNTNLLSPKEAPKSWEDLLDPKWKGKVAITTQLDRYVVLSQPGGWGKEKVRDYVRRLAANKPIITKNRTQMMALLAAGEFPIGSEAAALHRISEQTKKGAPIDWVRAGPLVFTGGAEIMSKNAPHPNAAQLWLDWVFSPEGIRAYGEASYKGSPFPGSGTQTAEAIKGLPYLVRDPRYYIENQEFKKELQRLLGIIT